MHGGNDVQQVKGVTVGAASEQVLARPRHRSGGVVAVVDGREDDAGCAVVRRFPPAVRLCENSSQLLLHSTYFLDSV